MSQRPDRLRVADLHPKEYFGINESQRLLWLLAADWIYREYGRLDILVDNAGIAAGGGAPSQTDLDAMREVYETNVLGVIMVTNAMLLRRAPAAPPLATVS